MCPSTCTPVHHHHDVARYCSRVGAERGDLTPRERSRGGDRDRDSRRNRDDATKDDTEAYEQPAADAREYAVKLEAELQRVYAGIFALMEKNLIPSARAGESKMPYCKLKDETTTDSNALEKEELDRKANHHGLMKAKIEEIPVRFETIEEKTVEVPQVQYTDRIVGVLVAAQRQVPTI